MPRATNDATDEELMLSFARGSTDAFSELFSRYKQPLFGFFRRRVPDPTHAEELTQETFLAILRASSRYEPTALFRTYLYAIAFKILRTHRRKSAFRAMFHSTDSTEPSSPTTIDTDFSVRDALTKLDSHDREILLLREFEQLTYLEIAELLALPINTVRSRLFRARTALHDLLTTKSSPATSPGGPSFTLLVKGGVSGEARPLSPAPATVSKSNSEANA
jgi:RNA polymerase sigma-70 factor (ECF subfamily)